MKKGKFSVLRKSKQSRCSKKVKNLHVLSAANREAWMTSEIFHEELRLWKEEKKISLNFTQLDWT